MQVYINVANKIFLLLYVNHKGLWNVYVYFSEKHGRIFYLALSNLPKFWKLKIISSFY